MRKTNIDWTWGSIEREYRDGVLVHEHVRLHGKHDWYSDIEVYKATGPCDSTVTRTDTYFLKPGKMPCLWMRAVQTSILKGNTHYCAIRSYRYNRANGRVVSEIYCGGLYRDCERVAWRRKVLIDGSHDYT